jgi:hypothetical protein
MLVCVDVIEGQPGACKCEELGADLGFELLASGGARKISHAPGKHILAHVSFRIRDAGDLLMRQRRPSIRKDDVQTDAKIRQTSSPSYRIGCRRSRNHQAGCSENSAAACPLDGFVDRFVQAEIVSGDDQVPLH